MWCWWWWWCWLEWSARVSEWVSVEACRHLAAPMLEMQPEQFSFCLFFLIWKWKICLTQSDFVSRCFCVLRDARLSPPSNIEPVKRKRRWTKPTSVARTEEWVTGALVREGGAAEHAELLEQGPLVCCKDNINTKRRKRCRALRPCKALCWWRYDFEFKSGFWVKFNIRSVV